MRAAAPAPVPAATQVPAANVSRPLTAAEQKRVDRARKLEQEQAKRDAEVALKRQLEQAKHDQEQAKHDAEVSALAAKKQAESDRKRQKALSDAAKSGKTPQQP